MNVRVFVATDNKNVIVVVLEVFPVKETVVQVTIVITNRV